MSHLQAALHISIVFYTVFVSSWIVRRTYVLHSAQSADYINPIVLRMSYNMLILFSSVGSGFDHVPN